MTEPRNVLEELLAIAAESANLTQGEVLDSLHGPDWDACRGWQWELYVPRDIRDLWGSLPTEAQLATFIAASNRAQEPSIRDSF